MTNLKHIMQHVSLQIRCPPHPYDQTPALTVLGMLRYGCGSDSEVIKFVAFSKNGKVPASFFFFKVSLIFI